MPKAMYNLIGQYIEEIKKIYGSHVRQIILYGSYARGDFRPDSDIDIMILVDMSDLTERKYTAADYKENSAVFTSNVIEPVLNHPGNLGMEKMAERIFMVLTRLLSDKGDYEDV